MLFAPANARSAARSLVSGDQSFVLRGPELEELASTGGESHRKNCKAPVCIIKQINNKNPKKIQKMPMTIWISNGHGK